MAPWNRKSKRSAEATDQQIIATGAAGGFGFVDPIDGDVGFRPVGSRIGRPVPPWTLEKIRAFSVAGYRSNPMARAIVDTYTSFCVGDSGVKLQCSNPDVEKIAHEFWDDPKNRMADQDVALRSHMLNGETIYELMVGPATGVTRRSVIDPARLWDVELENGNPIWPQNLVFRLPDGTLDRLAVAQLDDLSGLRQGDAMFWASWRALETDVRGWPFLAPVVDWLDMYDSVLSNLVDRTALARYLVWDVKIEGDQKAVNDFIDARKKQGLTGAPRSGTVEVHNQTVTWTPQSVDVGAQEDTTTSTVLLTNIAAGAGIAKTWLADPEHANRATSMTMAEPVRRRVGGVQNMWLAYQTELVRFAVDQAVRARRLDPYVATTDRQGTITQEKVPASMAVVVAGPEIAAQDAQITAGILFNLAQSLDYMTQDNILSPEARNRLAQKAWEDFMGVPYTAELDSSNASIDDLTQAADDSTKNAPITNGQMRKLLGQVSPKQPIDAGN